MPVRRRVASDNLFLIVHKKKKTARVASHSYNTLKEKMSGATRPRVASHRLRT